MLITFFLKARGKKPVRGKRKQDLKMMIFVETKFSFCTPYLCVCLKFSSIGKKNFLDMIFLKIKQNGKQ